MQQLNPWQTTSSQLVYQNPWIRVREDKVICPDGSPGIYGVVETKLATGVIALTPSHDIYLVGQYRYPLHEYSWELIEGGADAKEAPLDAAKRELKEEAGLTASDWHTLGEEIQLSNCFSSEIGMIYLAEGLTQDVADPEGTEVLQIKKVPFTQALEMVHAGTIKDSMSIIGIHRAAHFLSQR